MVRAGGRTAPVGTPSSSARSSPQLFPAASKASSCVGERRSAAWHAPGLQKHPVRSEIPRSAASSATCEAPHMA
jgi:hypothetical protein